MADTREPGGDVYLRLAEQAGLLNEDEVKARITPVAITRWRAYWAARSLQDAGARASAITHAPALNLDGPALTERTSGPVCGLCGRAEH